MSRKHVHDEGPLAVRGFDTPWGRMALAAGPQGVVRVILPGQDCRTEPNRLRRRSGGRASSEAEAHSENAEREVREYLAGRRRSFTVPVDLDGMSPFQRRTLRETRQVPFGETVAYGELASRVGRPRAARAVGQAMARNPVPLLVPCHRVVASSGGLGGFGGGLDLKRRLLALEAGVHGPAAP